MSEEKVHWKTKEKLDKEAALKVQQEWQGQTPPEQTTPPADVFGDAPAPTPAPGVKHVFGEQKAQDPDDTMLVSKSAFEKMVEQLNDLSVKVNGQAIDIDNDKKKKIIRVPFYVTDDGEEFIVIDLEDKKNIDGSLSKTWNRGRDELTNQIITWCNPVLVNLNTNVREVREIRYDEFSNVVRVNPLEVKHEEVKRVNLTTIQEEVEVASYMEKGGYLRRNGTGQLVKTAVWGVKTEFTVEFQGKEYVVNESVVNYK